MLDTRCSILDARPLLQAKNMDELLAQLIQAARSDDVEGWMNILIVVIIAVFWAISGILKARAGKPEEEQEQLAGKPTPRQPPAARGLKEKLLQQARPTQPVRPAPARKIGYPQPVAQRVTAKKRPIRIPTVEALKEPKLPRPAPRVRPAVEELPQLISKPVERPEPELAVESLLDYADPDELRRAILHYEILGKPLSLRGPGEQIIGL
ncbi:MAG: hypothetical protein ACE5NM_12040 [Sedimentisphaerales bacterium]